MDQDVDLAAALEMDEEALVNLALINSLDDLEEQPQEPMDAMTVEQQNAILRLAPVIKRSCPADVQEVMRQCIKEAMAKGLWDRGLNMSVSVDVVGVKRRRCSESGWGKLE